MGINNYRTAIVWATEPNNGNEFSWPESIRKYAEGDREGALIGLGHILHLIQDMTVPDHTRNDPHIGDGPVGLYTGESLYEDWARENKDQNTLRGLAIQYKNFAYRPRYLGSLEDYFKNIAGYSNSNYVSADTIDNPNNYYSHPQVIEKRNTYAYGEDSYFYDKHKLYVSQKGENNKEINSLVYKTGFEYDFSVLEEYFPRLAKMAVLSGTGVIQLFFTEAEEARADFLEAEKKEQDEIARQEAE